MALSCPICGSGSAAPGRGRGGLHLRSCGACGCRYLDPQAHPYDPAALYDQAYFAPWNLEPGTAAWRLREETAAARLALLASLGVRGRLLDVGCAGGYLVAQGARHGFDAHGIEISEHAARLAEAVAPGRITHGVLETAPYPPGSFDVITAFDLVEHHPEPVVLLARIRGLLSEGGFLAATVPDLSSVTGRAMGPAWPHYKEEHRFYPTRSAFRRLLAGAGLRVVHEAPARKRLSLAFLDPLLQAYPVPGLSGVSSLLARTLPRALVEKSFTVTIGERLYVARKES